MHLPDSIPTGRQKQNNNLPGRKIGTARRHEAAQSSYRKNGIK